jgi:hypothetical protein
MLDRVYIRRYLGVRDYSFIMQMSPEALLQAAHAYRMLARMIVLQANPHLVPRARNWETSSQSSTTSTSSSSSASSDAGTISTAVSGL